MQWVSGGAGGRLWVSGVQKASSGCRRQAVGVWGCRRQAVGAGGRLLVSGGPGQQKLSFPDRS